jgi:hypothetical protein
MEGLPDTPMLATFAAGCAFLVRHGRTGARTDLALAAVSLGFALGTKWYGVTAVAAVLAVWAVATLARRGWRALGRDGGVVLALVAVVGGFWLIRNLVAVGNPVFPLKVAPLGVTVFDAPLDPLRMQNGHPLARYLLDGDAWDRWLLPDFGPFLSLAALVLAAGLVAAGFVAAARVRRVAERDLGERVVLAAVVAAVMIAVLYVLTPYSGQGVGDAPTFAWPNVRYGLSALVLAAAVGAWLCGRLGRAGMVIEVAALAGIVDGVRLGQPVSARWVLLALLALAAAAGVVYVVRRRRPSLLVAGGAAAVVAAGVVLAGHGVQRRFMDHRYVRVDPVLDAIRTGAPSGHRIGLAGAVKSQQVLPAFGPRLRNHVGYAGEVRRGMLRRASSAAAFGAAIRAGDYDLLVVGRGRDLFGRPAVEEAWASRAGWVAAVRSPHFTLFRRPG